MVMGQALLPTAGELAVALRRRELGARELLEQVLQCIDRHERKIQAWVSLDIEGARAQAEELDREAAAGRFRGPLHGIPVGVKDIFHVAGMVTTTGAAPFAHQRADRDAAAVAALREAGAIILGKTVTTEFAFLDPAATRNPWNLEHTPGGSSSGSAAAVAAGMVPLALGSQTVGSTLRPAAYCGIVGLKPTFGRIDREGMLPLAPSLDHVGILAASVEDAALAYGVVAREPLPQLELWSLEPPRLGLLRRYTEQGATAAMRAHLEEVSTRLAQAGARLIDIDLPCDPETVHRHNEVLLLPEVAAVHAERYASHADELGPILRAKIEQGMGYRAVDYLAARRFREDLQRQLVAALTDVDALLLPVAPAAAPRGLDSTGDPLFCIPASLCGLPALALPSGLDAHGLPLAVQLVAAPGAEARLLAVGRFCERALGWQRRLPPAVS